MTDQGPGATQRFIGLALMVVAGLWMAFSGLCAVGVLTTVVSESAATSDMLGLGLAVLFISGLSAAGGYAIFVTGRSLMGGK
ncbi:MAG: hypothetical protein KBA31_01305 [Alphaproteobacteria bacterium]|nr:hypothetical protein [Alphaproteobacteria bacterium]